MYLCSVMITEQRHIGLQRHGENAVTGEAPIESRSYSCEANCRIYRKLYNQINNNKQY